MPVSISSGVAQLWARRTWWSPSTGFTKNPAPAASATPSWRARRLTWSAKISLGKLSQMKKPPAGCDHSTSPGMYCSRAASALSRRSVYSERVRSPAHLRRPAVDTAPDDALGTEQPPQPQAGRKRFGETANARRLLALRQGVETRRDRPLKREVAIDIVLHNQEAIVARQPDHLETPRFGQRATRRVVKGRHGIEHAGYSAAGTKPCQLSF